MAHLGAVVRLILENGNVRGWISAHCLFAVQRHNLVTLSILNRLTVFLQPSLLPHRCICSLLLLIRTLRVSGD